jgi:AsmA protein
MYPSRRRRRRPLRAIAVTLASLLLVILLAIGAAVVLIDPNAYKAQIAAMVKQRTGRDLAIGGRITILPSLTPTIQADDLTLSNAPGGSQPVMVSVGHVEAEIALLPLFAHRLVINRLVLIRPRILLETAANGAPNWVFQPAPSTGVAAPAPGPTAATATAGTAAPAAPSMELDMRSIHVREAAIDWRDGATRRSVAVAVPRLDASTASETDPILAHVECGTGGVAAVAEVTAGSLARLEDTSAISEFPLRVTARGAGAELTISGTIAHPLRGRGYALAITGAAPDLAAVGDALGRRLPRLSDVAIAARVSDNAAGAPVWSALSLQAGHSPLDALAPGFALDALSLSAADLSEPIKLDGKGSYGGADVFASGTLASVATLMPSGAAAGPAPLDLTLGFAGITGTAKGVVGAPEKLSGVDVALDFSSHDLAPFLAATRARLPSFKEVGLKARLTEAGASLRDGAVLRDLTFSTPGGDLSGEAALEYDGRPSLHLALTSPRLDLDALLASMGAVAGPAPAVQAAPPPAVAVPRSPTPPPAAAVAPPPDTAVRLVVPDRPIPLAMLRAGDADIDLKLAALTVAGAIYHDVAAHLALRDGHLSLDPLAADTPGGHVSGTLTADAGAPDMPVSIGLRTRGLSLKPLLAGSADPDAASGTALIDVDLRGAGPTPHDFAASADGHIGVSISDGEIDDRLLGAIATDLLRSPRLADSLGAAAASGTAARTTRLRCFAGRVDVSRGTASVTTLLLDSTRLTLQGSGTIAMGDEAVSLRLRPTLHIGGARGGGGQGVAVPLRIGGNLSDLKVAVDAGGALEALGSRATNVPDRGVDPCPAALAAVAGPPPAPPPAAIPASTPAQAPPATASQTAPVPAANQKMPNSAQILRGLLH